MTALIVLGSRGHSAVAGLLAGSITIDVSCRAHCPVGWNGSPAVIETVSATERHSLDMLLRHWREKFPALPVTIEVSLDDAGRVLTEASFDAQLVVVGSRGRGPFQGALLGSISQHLQQHSACSVAIVRGPGQGT